MSKPMTLAQTIVELPKYGASRRDAAISVASEPTPAAKTTPVRVASKRLFTPLDDDHGRVVVEPAAGEGPRVVDDGSRELARRQLSVLREETVEPLMAVELALSPRLDHAVGEENDRAARVELLAGLRVALVGGDPEREAAGRELDDPAVVADEARVGMAGAGASELAALRVERQIDERHELALLQLFDGHLVRRPQEAGRIRVLPRQRAEDELRHRHVGRGVDPLARHVTDDHCEPAVGKRRVVEDVAADVEPGRRLIDAADFDSGQDRRGCGQKRTLHRVGEAGLLLVQPGVVDGEGRLGSERTKGLDRLGIGRPTWVERHGGERPKNPPP